MKVAGRLKRYLRDILRYGQVCCWMLIETRRKSAGTSSRRNTHLRQGFALVTPMFVERIKCTDCDAMILPQTASRNGGLCAHCAKTPEPLRRARQAFDHQVSTGLVYTPSHEERRSAKLPAEFGRVLITWELEPDYYKDVDRQSVQETTTRASTQSDGFVFLIANGGARLNLSFNRTYGVCEYQCEASGDCLYAYTPENLREQVNNDVHLIQACPCCGVGLLWYPSRFHMPRQLAFEIFLASIAGKIDAALNVEWLDCGDISYTARGRG